MLTCDTYLMPNSLQEALQLWADASSRGGRLVAGATDTLPWARQGRAGDIAGDVHVPIIVDISKVEELTGHEELGGGRFRLGANVVFQAFLENETLRRLLPCMPYCAIWFADDQIRQQATLAGNIVNASPAADGTPPLLTLNASVEMARLDPGGIERRTASLQSFVVGPGKTSLGPGEIVTAVECDSLPGYGGAFEKVGQRRALVISTVCAACCVKVSDNKRRFEDVRLAMGGIGPVPVRLDDVESFLRGKSVSFDVISAAADEAGDRVQSRSRQEYRKIVVRGFIERALIDALRDAGVTLSADAEEGDFAHA